LYILDPIPFMPYDMTLREGTGHVVMGTCSYIRVVLV
jgi:hypothetical protein